MAGLTVHGSEFARVEVSSDGANWAEIPGVNSYTESGGEAPQRDVVAFQGVSQRTGVPRLPSIEIGAIVAPAHSVWKDLYEAFTEQETRQFRITTKEETLFTVATGGTAAIATTGTVTFAGGATIVHADFTGNDYAPGMALRIGSDTYIIDTISDAGVVKVAPVPSAAVSAGSYSVRIPSLRRGPMVCGIRLVGRATLAAEGDLSTTLTLAPRGELPDFVIV